MDLLRAEAAFRMLRTPSKVQSDSILLVFVQGSKPRFWQNTMPDDVQRTAPLCQPSAH